MDETSTALSIEIKDSAVENLNESAQACQNEECISKSDTSSIFSKINDNSPKWTIEL